MFSALKFVAAGVIVALFGSVLLAGITGTRQEDEVVPAAATASTTPLADRTLPAETESPVKGDTMEMLTGFETTEIAPGILRIDSDGHRSLDLEPGEVDTVDVLVIGYDGSIWYNLKDRLYQLGEGRTVKIPAKRRFGARHVEVAPDGTIWTTETAGAGERKRIGGVETLSSFDGERWTRHKERPVDFDIAPDGTVWAAWRGSGHNTVVGSYGDAGWKRLPGSVKYGDGLSVSHEGEVWVSQWYDPFFQMDDPPHPDMKSSDEPQPVLFRYVDDEWRNEVGPHAPLRQASGDGAYGLGSDRVLRIHSADGRDLYFEDGTWLEWQLPAQQPAWGEGWPAWGLWDDDGFKHAPDGSLWAQWLLPPEPGPCGFVCPPDRPDGVVRFAGDSFQHLLPGYDLQFRGFTPDGSAWFTGNESAWTLPEDDDVDPDSRPVHLYAITPEAVAGSG